MRILNEIKYAEELIQKGFIQKKYEFELKILAKYYYSQDIKDEDLKNKIIEFCNKYISKFNEIKYLRMIKRVCTYGSKYSLFVVKPIRITQEELTKIKSLDDLKIEKIAFVLLVLSNINKQSYTLYMKDKIRNIVDINEKKKESEIYKKLKFPTISKEYFVNDKISNIFKLAKVYLKKDKKNEIIKFLIDKKFIEMSKSCKYKLNYIQHKTNDTALYIKTFDDFVLEYEGLIGDNIGHCENVDCNKPIRITSNRIKYCRKCWKEKEKENHKERNRKWYKNKISDGLENTL